MTRAELLAAQKSLPRPRDWALREEEEQKLSTVLEIVSELDADGVTMEGLRMRISTLKLFPDENVCFQIEAKPERMRYEPICRIEWRPRAGHNNQGLGPLKYRYKEIVGSHFHTFELNWLPAEQRMRFDNLPVAIPIDPDPVDFESLLDFIEREVRISLVGKIAPPPWEGVLL